MGESDLREAFLRFRDHGDVTAFATVFDRTAPDLLELARRLSPQRDGGDSPEDLVQATFVIAIEKRRHFDESRPLEPWLAGILAHLALAAKRRARRATRRPLDDAPGTEDSAVEARELWRAVERATADLPPAYRDLVAARVFAAERPREAAARARRPAGVIRMQLHRGLTLLRRALPKGLLASFFLTADSRVALCAARNAALAHARNVAAFEPLAAPLALGGLAVSKKLALAIAATGLLWVGVRLFLVDPNRPDSDADVTEAARSVETASGAAEFGTTDATAALAESTAREPAIDSIERDDSPFPESYRRALSAVRGRLIEASGAPAAFLDLALLSFDRDRLASDLDPSISSRPPLDVLTTTRTDGDGRFRFIDLEPARTFALGIDPRGPRATLKLIDAPLASGEETDLGDLRLGPILALLGRVVDERGEPVSNARVRATPIPGPIAALGLERITPDSLVMFAERNPIRVEPLPAWLSAILRELPIPTTTSGEDGRFALSGVAPGRVTVIVDHERFTTRAFGPFPSRDSVSLETGDLELLAGREIAGVVLDEARRPIADVEVGVGTTGLVKSRAILERRTSTGEDGRFVARHISEDGDCVVAVRRGPTEAWSIHNGEAAVLEILLESRFSHVVQVVNERGDPVRDAEFRVCARSSIESRPLLERNEEWSTPRHSQDPANRGEYRLLELSPGGYVGIVRDGRGGAARFEFEVEDGAGSTNVVLPAPRTLELTVVDSATREPVEHALVRWLSSDDPNATLAQARTDPNGGCELQRSGGSADADFAVAVDHPGYARRTERVEDETTSLEIALDRGGELAGTITIEGISPMRRHTIVLSPPSDLHFFVASSPPMPLVLSSSEQGTFAAHRLRAGGYSYEIFDDLVGADLSSLASKASADIRSLEPRSLRRGSFAIVGGETTELTIDIVPPGSARNGAIEGRVTSAGRPLTTAAVYIDGSADRRFHQVDGDGRYTIRDVPPGEVEVHLYDFAAGESDGGYLRNLLRRKVDVPSGGVAVADFRLAEHPFRVFVRDRGAAAPGVMVELQRITERNILEVVCKRPTGSDGGVEIAANETGEFRLIADDPARGFAVATIEVRGGGLDADRHIDLDPGITVAGKVDLGDRPGVEPFTLGLVVRLGEGWFYRDVEIDPKVRTFRFPHVPAGELRFTLSDGSGESRRTAATLDHDREDLTLEFPRE